MYQVSKYLNSASFGSISDCVAKASPGDTCKVANGLYREEVDFNKNIRIVGESKAGVVLDGRDVVDTEWSVHEGAIYKTVLPEEYDTQIAQVFAEDSMLVEARWPNVDYKDIEGSMLDVSFWATAKNSSTYGTIVDADLAEQTQGIDWNGAIATLNVGKRINTYTRTVQNYTNGTFNYLLPLPGETLRSLPTYIGNPYYLSGILSALDSPGEWYHDVATRTLYLWSLDGGIPKGISIKRRGLCVQGVGVVPPGPEGGIVLQNLTFFGCTVSLYQCEDCLMQDLNIFYPALPRRYEYLDIPRGPMPNTTTLNGNSSRMERLHIQHTNINGILLIGSNNVITDCLVESTTWSGGLLFPAIQIGFGDKFCGQGNDENFEIRSTLREEECGNWLEHAPDTVAAKHLKEGLGKVYGEGNVISRTTVNGFGNSGIVTSQLSCEVEFVHVLNGGLIGCDHAGIHADNLPTPCMYDTNASNCTKSFHHNFVHDCREKCVRGDDATVNLTVHHNVIWNCGYPKRDVNCGRSASGLVLKGDYNTAYAVTAFNVTFPLDKKNYSASGELVVMTALGPPPPSCTDDCLPMNAHSQVINIAAQTVTTRGGPALNTSVTYQGGLISAAYDDLHFRDLTAWDFRPTNLSALYRAGVVHPPYTPDTGHNPDAGCMQAEDDLWRPGCLSFDGC